MSNKLFDLIQSLDQSEKRYFKIFASSHVKGEQNNYVRLFEAIDKQDVYDETALLKKFDKERFVKQFAVTKNYLYNILLRSLRNYNEGKKVESKINENLAILRILYQKGQHKNALNILKKTKKLATDYELFEQKLSILKLEEKFQGSLLKLTDYLTTLESLYKEKKQLLKLLDNQYLLGNISAQISTLYNRYNIVRNEEEKKIFDDIIAQNPILENIDNALSFNAKESWLDIWSIYYTVTENHEKLYEYDSKIAELYEKHPLIKSEMFYNYMMARYNLLHTYKEMRPGDHSLIGKIHELRELVNKESKKLGKPVKILLAVLTYSMEIEFYYSEFEFKECLQLLPKIKKFIKDNSDLIMLEYKNDIYFTYAKIFFFLDNFKESANYLELVQLDNRSLSEDHSTYQVKILNLLLHYEFGNFALLDSELKATRRFLKINKRLYDIEKMILKYLQKLIHVSSDKQRIQLFEKMKTEFEELVQNATNKNVFLRYLKFPFWIESQLQNKKMQVLIQEKLKLES